MFKIGDTVKLPRFFIDRATITAIYPSEGYYGITGKTSPGGTEYNNTSFPSEEVYAI